MDLPVCSHIGKMYRNLPERNKAGKGIQAKAFVTQVLRCKVIEARHVWMSIKMKSHKECKYNLLTDFNRVLCKPLCLVVFK